MRKCFVLQLKELDHQCTVALQTYVKTRNLVTGGENISEG